MSRMASVLHSEYRKFVTTRMWWVLLAIMAAYMAFMAGVLAFSSTVSAPGAAGDANPFLEGPATAISIYTIAVAAGYIFPVIIGAFSVTGEFRHKTITPTLLAQPSRTRVLLAKLVAAVPVGLAYGIAGVGIGVGTGAGVLALTGHQTYLGDPSIWWALGRAVLAMVVWTLVGVAFGSAISSQVAVIVVLLAFTQFVEPLVRIGLGVLADGRFAAVGNYLPGAAGDAMTGASIYSAFGQTALLAWWQGLLVLLAYVAVLTVIGRVTTFRRDIT